jgi:hypothetical protein
MYDIQNEPTRRAAFKFGTAALLAGFSIPALAGNVAESPDADLLRLGRELDKAVATEAAAFADTERNGGGWSEAGDVALHDKFRIVDEIELLNATTLAGIHVKLRAVRACLGGDPITAEELAGHEGPATDMRLIADLLNDLSAIEGAGA